MKPLTDYEVILLTDRIKYLGDLILNGHSTYTDEFELEELKEKLSYNQRLQAFLDRGFRVIEGGKLERKAG